MRFNIITNLNNGVGLERDYRLLKELLEGWGHQVKGVQFNGNDVAPNADVNIFLETVAEKYYPSAKWQWVVPNAEWWFKGWDAQIKKFEWILCKTRHCESVFSAKGGNCRYLGWKSRDFYNPTIRKERKVLHVAGKSQTKNTTAVLNCWKFLKPTVDLTVVSEHYRCDGIPRTKHFRRVDEEQLTELMNSHQIHLMPSAYEGWGHALREGMGVGAVVITTDAPPMNEMGSAVLIPASGSRPHHSAPLHSVSQDEVFKAVNRVLKMRDADLDVIGQSSRERFLRDNAAFEARLLSLVGRA